MRKQNANVHLMGVHELTKADLEKLGRWQSRMKEETEDCPEYLVRSLKKKLKNREKKSMAASSSTGDQKAQPKKMPQSKSQDMEEGYVEITIKDEPIDSLA